VIVEWFNVSSIESSSDWAYLRDEIGREGDAYVGVSAQARGVNGGGTPLVNVNVDAKAAAAAGVSTNASGLKNVDPARYGTLVHPGDAYAFDIFSQVGRAVEKRPEVLGGLVPKHVIATGQSQSAGFLTTVANAIHPLDPVYDGFLIHSRGANPAPLDGKYKSNAHGKSTGGADFTKGRVQVRSDLHVPTLIFETETDVELLGYANARQPDSDSVRTWEVAGTSHTDAHLIRALIGGPRDPNAGHLLGCTAPINTGPHHEVFQAALHHLVDWTAGGAPPPKAERIELKKGRKVVIARDENGIAIGGVRNPLVDVPIAATTGEPPGNADLAKADVCGLFGTTVSFDQAKLVDLYGTFDNYLQKFEASAADAVAGGFLLQADADALIVEAQHNAALFPPS
jgi:Alpha/beta hydrolase domain